jgi:hypothetical protein
LLNGNFHGGRVQFREELVALDLGRLFCDRTVALAGPTA